MSRINDLVKNTAILSLATLCTKALSFIMIPFFSAWLSVSEYGEFDLLYTYMSLLIPIFTLSCGEALFRKLLDSTEVKKELVISCTLFITVVGIACIDIILFIASIIYDSKIFNIYILLITSNIIYQYFLFYARGRKKLLEYALSSIVFILFMVFFVILFVKIMNLGIRGMLYGYSIGYLVASLFIINKTNFLKDFIVNKPNIETYKEVLSYSLPLIPNSISWWIADISDRSIIALYLGTSFNGIYAIANKIPAICSTMFSVFHISWQESASNTIKDVDRDYYYTYIFNNLVKIICGICSLIIVIDPFIFRYAIDSAYIDAYNIVPILVSAVMFSFLTQFYGGIFIALEKTKYNGVTTVIGAVLNIILNLIFIKQYGLYAAALSTLVSYIIIMITRWYLIKGIINIKFDNRNIVYCFIYIIFVYFHYINMHEYYLVILCFGIIFFIWCTRAFFYKILSRILKKRG